MDSLLILIKNDKPDTNKIIHLNLLARENILNSSYDNARHFANEAWQLVKSFPLKMHDRSVRKHLANTYNYLGVLSKEQSDYKNALDYYLEALKIDEELNDKAGMAKRLGNIGLILYDEADYPKALDYTFRALKMDEELKNKNGIARHLGNLGLIYKQQNDYKKALNYYFKALTLAEELENKQLQMNSLGNMGVIYREEQDHDKAREHFLKSLKIAEEINNKNSIAATLGSIGMLYYDDDDFIPALEYFKRAFKISEELGDKIDMALWAANIGGLYSKAGKYNDAFPHIYNALAIDKSIGALDAVKKDYKILSTLYENSNIPLCDSMGGKLLNMEQMRLRSLYYFKRYVSIRDTLFSEENKKQLVRKEMNFDFEKKEAATKAEQDKKDALSKEELKQKEQQRNYFVIGFLLVAVLAIFIFKGYRQKQKANIVITEQKALVDEKQKEILDSIYYAQRIQRALLPSEKHLGKTLTRLNKKT